MEMLSVSQYAEQNGISERTVRNWCATGKMEGAVLVGKTWNIPADAPLPRKGKTKESPLLKRLREEKEGKVSGGIYHRTRPAGWPDWECFRDGSSSFQGNRAPSSGRA